jgi:hypothetical protein
VQGQICATDVDDTVTTSIRTERSISSNKNLNHTELLLIRKVSTIDILDGNHFLLYKDSQDRFTG